jgi:hypothetical protein
MTPVGFSHSEISGSKPVCDSPELFAANYVLHRHLTPRHPSCALSSLTANLAQSPEGALQKCWVVFATINYRDTPSRIAIPRGTSIPTPSSTSCAGLADAVQGRDRSSSSEPRLWIPFDARFHSQDTLSRHCHFFELSKNFRCLSTTDSFSSAWKQTSQRSRRNSELSLVSVERKGFEPSTPGLQSRCSPS